MISSSGITLLKGMALLGSNPCLRSAKASIRFKTPTKSFLPHLGQMPLSFLVSFGKQENLQSAWPSKWYFPSSGKNSSVCKNVFGFLSLMHCITVPYDSFDSSISKTFASRPSLRRLCASELETKAYLSSAEICQFILGSDDRPVSMAKMCLAWSPKASSTLSNPDRKSTRLNSSHSQI